MRRLSLLLVAVVALFGTGVPSHATTKTTYRGVVTLRYVGHDFYEGHFTGRPLHAAGQPPYTSTRFSLWYDHYGDCTGFDCTGIHPATWAMTFPNNASVYGSFQWDSHLLVFDPVFGYAFCDEFYGDPIIKGGTNELVGATGNGTLDGCWTEGAPLLKTTQDRLVLRMTLDVYQ